MINKTDITEWPEAFQNELKEIELYTKEYLAALKFIAANASRDPEYVNNYPISYIGIDFIQSALSVIGLSNEGFFSVLKRELRFLLEASIKLCFIQQNKYTNSIEEKLAQFKNELNSPKITIKKKIKLDMIKEDSIELMQEAIGRLYGETSNYVHLSVKQINDRIESVNSGNLPGKETIDEMRKVKELVFSTYELSLTLLFHSVSEYVAGDFFVEDNGKTIDLALMKSKYLQEIDSSFDYKSERQEILELVKSKREKIINSQ